MSILKSSVFILDLKMQDVKETEETNRAKVQM